MDNIQYSYPGQPASAVRLWRVPDVLDLDAFFHLVTHFGRWKNVTEQEPATDIGVAFRVRPYLAYTDDHHAQISDYIRETYPVRNCGYAAFGVTTNAPRNVFVHLEQGILHYVNVVGSVERDDDMHYWPAQTSFVFGISKTSPNLYASLSRCTFLLSMIDAGWQPDFRAGITIDYRVCRVMPQLLHKDDCSRAQTAFSCANNNVGHGPQICQAAMFMGDQVILTWLTSHIYDKITPCPEKQGQSCDSCDNDVQVSGKRTCGCYLCDLCKTISEVNRSCTNCDVRYDDPFPLDIFVKHFLAGSPAMASTDISKWTSTFVKTIPSFQDFGRVAESQYTKVFAGHFVSSPNGACAIHALLQFIKWDTRDQLETLVADLQAYSTMHMGLSMMKQDVLLNIAASLKIPTLRSTQDHTGEFSDALHYAEQQPIKSLQDSWRTRGAIIIITSDMSYGHVGVYKPRSQRYFVHVSQALELIRLSQIPKATQEVKTVRNGKHKKPVSKSSKGSVRAGSFNANPNFYKKIQASDLLEQYESPEAYVEDIDPVDYSLLTRRQDKKAHIRIRGMEMPEYRTLPATHVQDDAWHVIHSKVRLGFKGMQPIPIQSKMQYLIVASMNKQRHPLLFEDTGLQTVTRYEPTIANPCLGAEVQFVLPLVDHASSHLPTNLLASLYSDRPSNIIEKKDIHVPMLTLSVDGPTSGTVTPHIRGHLSLDVQNVFQAYGEGTSRQDVKNTPLHSGHCAARSAANIMQAKSITALNQSIMLQPGSVTVVDVGAKISHAKLVSQQANSRFTGYDSPCDSIEERIRYAQRMGLEKDIDEILSIAMRNYVSVRPKVSQYDKAYHDQNKHRYQQMARRNKTVGQLAYWPVIPSYLQDIESTIVDMSSTTNNPVNYQLENEHNQHLPLYIVNPAPVKAVGGDIAMVVDVMSNTSPFEKFCSKFLSKLAIKILDVYTATEGNVDTQSSTAHTRAVLRAQLERVSTFQEGIDLYRAHKTVRAARMGHGQVVDTSLSLIREIMVGSGRRPVDVLDCYDDSRKTLDEILLTADASLWAYSPTQLCDPAVNAKLRAELSRILIDGSPAVNHDDISGPMDGVESASIADAPSIPVKLVLSTAINDCDVSHAGNTIIVAATDQQLFYGADPDLYSKWNMSEVFKRTGTSHFFRVRHTGNCFHQCLLTRLQLSPRDYVSRITQFGWQYDSGCIEEPLMVYVAYKLNITITLIEAETHILIGPYEGCQKVQILVTRTPGADPTSEVCYYDLLSKDQYTTSQAIQSQNDIDLTNLLKKAHTGKVEWVESIKKGSQSMQLQYLHKTDQIKVQFRGKRHLVPDYEGTECEFVQDVNYPWPYTWYTHDTMLKKKNDKVIKAVAWADLPSDSESSASTVINDCPVVIKTVTDEATPSEPDSVTLPRQDECPTTQDVHANRDHSDAQGDAGAERPRLANHSVEVKQAVKEQLEKISDEAFAGIVIQSVQGQDGVADFKPIQDPSYATVRLRMFQKQETRVALLMNDVHYYLGGYQPCFETTLFISGMNFFPVPGMYYLPENEGRFQIYRDVIGQDAFGMVTMITRGSGISYSHPLVHVAQPDNSIHWGWHTHFKKTIHYQPGQVSPFEKVWLPRHTNFHSVQARFLLDIARSKNQAVAGISKLISYQEAKWSAEAITDQDVSDMSRPVVMKTTMARIRMNLSRKFNGRCAQSELHYLRMYQEWTLRFPSQWITFSAPVRKLNNPIISVVHEMTNTLDRDVPNGWQLFRNGALLSKVTYERAAPSGDRMLGATLTQYVRDNYTSELSELPMRELVASVTAILQRPAGVQKAHAPPTTMVARNYYYVKPITSVEDLPRAIQRSVAVSRNKANTASVNAWLLNNPVPIDDGGRALTVEASATFSGYRTVDHTVNEFEWNSRSVHNLIYGLYNRQFGSRQTLAADHLIGFQKMMERFLAYYSSRFDLTDSGLATLEPYDYICERTDFDSAKKRKYLTSFAKYVSQPSTRAIGTFRAMAKSGEVELTTDVLTSQPYLQGQNSRPRIICVPSQRTCGFATVIQSRLWQAQKRVYRGFVQGLTKQQLDELFQCGADTRGANVCMDGTAFDSSQFHQLQTTVDAQIYGVWRSKITEQLELNALPWVNGVDVKNAVNRMIDDLQNVNNTIFVRVPGVQGPEFTQKHVQDWNTDWAGAYGKYSKSATERDWLVYDVQGTTFSGHPVATTMMNTWRQLCYNFYYLECSGIREPWRRDDVTVLAAGDDAVQQFRSASLAAQAILGLHVCSSTSPEGSYGLGQRMKVVEATRWDDIRFCSKWSFSDGTVQSLAFTRDYKKMFTQKQYYMKSNAQILSSPGAHAKAMYNSLAAEKSSRLLEDLAAVRAYNLGDVKTDAVISQWSPFASDLSYALENQLDARLGISLRTLYDLVDHGMQYLGADSVSPTTSIVVDSSSLAKRRQENQQKQKQKRYYRRRVAIKCVIRNKSIRDSTIKRISKIGWRVMGDKNQSVPSVKKRRKNGNMEGAFQAMTKAIQALTSSRQQRVPREKQPFDQLREDKRSANYDTELKHLFLEKDPTANLARFKSPEDVEAARVHKMIMAMSENKKMTLLGRKAFVQYQTSAPAGVPTGEWLAALLADDLPEGALGVVRGLATTGANWLFNTLRNHPIARGIRSALGMNDTRDLNDDGAQSGYNMGNKYVLNKSLNRQVQWTDLDPDYYDATLSYDGVSTQAVASMLVPESTRTRVPSDIQCKTGLTARTQTVTLTTNASGNAAFIIYPQRVTQTNWIGNMSAATFNPSTGTSGGGDPLNYYTDGPMVGLTTVSSYKTTATSLTMQPIVSSLQNGGRIVSVINTTSAAQNINSAPTGIDNARDSEYVVYNSVAASAGHRLVYVNTANPNEQLAQYATSSIPLQYMMIIVAGAQPSTAILEIDIAYQIEYQITTNILIELSTAPPGAATLKCLVQAVNRRPELRLLGKQESNELYRELLTVVPNYQQVLRLLCNMKFAHLPDHRTQVGRPVEDHLQQSQDWGDADSFSS